MIPKYQVTKVFHIPWVADRLVQEEIMGMKAITIEPGNFCQDLYGTQLLELMKDAAKNATDKPRAPLHAEIENRWEHYCHLWY